VVPLVDPNDRTQGVRRNTTRPSNNHDLLVASDKEQLAGKTIVLTAITDHNFKATLKEFTNVVTKSISGQTRYLIWGTTSRTVGTANEPFLAAISENDKRRVYNKNNKIVQQLAKPLIEIYEISEFLLRFPGVNAVYMRKKGTNVVPMAPIPYVSMQPAYAAPSLTKYPAEPMTPTNDDCGASTASSGSFWT
jgi:hypothetical protein